MIPPIHITAWRSIASWGSPDQVEHDLVLSRAICELYAHPEISKRIVFRGGTALHKLFFEQAGRFSEDLDFVQIQAEPIGETVLFIRECLDHWLGAPSWKQNQGRFTLNYRFKTEIEPIVTRKVKIEINTREHFNVHPYATKTFSVKNPWYTGEAQVLTYSIEELLGTKLRALYQRKKGRDLYDFWYAMEHLPELNTNAIIKIFERYMSFVDARVTRAEFEKNLWLKANDPLFYKDILALLSNEQVKKYPSKDAYHLSIMPLIEKMRGEPWKAS